MKNQLRALGLFAGFAALLAMAAGLGAEAGGPASAPKPAGPPAYRFVTSDLMNAVIQPRHTKLWLAGSNGDWDYAEYERHNIGGVLERMATAVPAYKDQ